MLFTFISQSYSSIIRENGRTFINLKSTEKLHLSHEQPSFASKNWYYTEFVEHSQQGIKLECLRDTASESQNTSITWYKNGVQVIPNERYPLLRFSLSMTPFYFYHWTCRTLTNINLVQRCILLSPLSAVWCLRKFHLTVCSYLKHCLYFHTLNLCKPISFPLGCPMKSMHWGGGYFSLNYVHKIIVLRFEEKNNKS